MQHNRFPCLNIYLIDKSTLIEYRHTKLNQNMLDHDRRKELKRMMLLKIKINIKSLTIDINM